MQQRRRRGSSGASPTGEPLKQQGGDDVGAGYEHAWNWWKYHADQRITLLRFYILSLGGVGVAVGWLRQQQIRFFAPALALSVPCCPFVFFVSIPEHQTSSKSAKMLFLAKKLDYLYPLTIPNLSSAARPIQRADIGRIAMAK
jgi:hypothetical protein